MLLGSRSRRSWARMLVARQARQSNPQKIAVAEFSRPFDRTDHRRPLIRAPRNHYFVVPPTGRVGLQCATHSRAIVTERGGLPKCCLITLEGSRYQYIDSANLI